MPADRLCSLYYQAINKLDINSIKGCSFTLYVILSVYVNAMSVSKNDMRFKCIDESLTYVYLYSR